MSSAGSPLPPIRVILPDDQEVRGRLHERRQWPRGGWMYRVGLPMWANDAQSEGVEPREYLVWLTPEQARPVDGVSYEDVPTHSLPREADQAPPADRWAWKVQRIPPRNGRPGQVVVHVWDCADAPAGDPEVDVHEALDVLRTVAGAVPCKECGAAVALGPLTGSDVPKDL
ncbi:DUF6233 domain-containing protein [Streptomyces chartreusis]|uniref:DUF6233 domain-containing protein n=1 Tax=Streptomyces chartreusis TaxID=1969 RepID=UPI002F90D95F|nr:DUF6233 domain-containing protein [Streptomyces chartreusis]